MREIEEVKLTKSRIARKQEIKEICAETEHVFEDAHVGLVHPYMSNNTYVPVEYCRYCGLLRAKLK